LIGGGGGGNINSIGGSAGATMFSYIFLNGFNANSNFQIGASSVDAEGLVYGVGTEVPGEPGIQGAITYISFVDNDNGTNNTYRIDAGYGNGAIVGAGTHGEPTYQKNGETFVTPEQLFYGRYGTAGSSSSSGYVGPTNGLGYDTVNLALRGRGGTSSGGNGGPGYWSLIIDPTGPKIILDDTNQANIILRSNFVPTKFQGADIDGTPSPEICFMVYRGDVAFNILDYEANSQPIGYFQEIGDPKEFTAEDDKFYAAIGFFNTTKIFSNLVHFQS
jgi:hypothetical protein